MTDKHKLKYSKHDALVKKIMSEVASAKEFLEHYLPTDFKQLVDLSKLKVEKETFVTNDLKRQLSDIVYSVPTLDGKTALVYILAEHQSTVDNFIALRLWQYILLLCERHKKDKGKLPLICPIVIYSGKEPYSAAQNLWQLFDNPLQAKKLMTEDYKLVNLQSMPDDEIIKQRHIGMMQYMLKHIHQRDILKLWEDFLGKFQAEIIVDKEHDYIYIRSFLWYTDTKLPEDRQSALEQLLAKYLSEEEKGNIMRTVAQKYIEEGTQYGIQIGEARGEARGEKKKAMVVAKNLLKASVSVDIISTSTGLSKKEIEELMV